MYECRLLSSREMYPYLLHYAAMYSAAYLFVVMYDLEVFRD